MKHLLLALALLAATPAFAAAPTPETQQEITHLLDHLERSGCRFQRNGDWHEAKAARAHLEKKYHYLLDKGLVSTAESFIERGATASSVSGKPYQVQCPGQPLVDSGPWFQLELARVRKGGGK